MGESNEGQSDLEGLPMSSIVYVGRGSFRMEAIAVEAELERRQGVVQPMTGAVTAPLHAGARREDGRTTSMSWKAPDLRPLFGSQVDVPLLAAPTGSASFPGTAVSISRVALAALGGVVLLCGVVIGTATRHLLASPAAITTVPAPVARVELPVVAAPVAAAPTPVTAAIVVAPVAPVAPVTPIAPVAPAAIVSPKPPVAVRAHVKPAVKRVPVEPAPKAPVKAIASHWVDPFAE